MEQQDVARFTREIRALGKAAAWDCESFAQAVQLQTELERVLANAAQDLNSQGFSWAEIAAPLGITRAAAHKRYATS